MNELIKEIKNGRMLKNNGSWMYCSKCDKTVGYLCYTTFQSFQFAFKCHCGNSGKFSLKYETKSSAKTSKEDLKLLKNRLCCPKDDSPLFTIVNKNIEKANYSVVCKKGMTEYKKIN